jgi:hypothetical protein
MQQITVEPALGQQLSELAGQAVLCDSSGRALGFFHRFTNRCRLKICSLNHPCRLPRQKNYASLA